MAQRRLTSEEQLIVAIEQLALGYKYVIKQKKLKVTEFVNFLDEMRNPDLSDERETGVERKYSDYRKVFREFDLPIRIDFKSGYIQNYKNKPDIIKSLVQIYLKSLHPNYNQKAIDSFILNIKDVNDALYFIVTIKYFIKYKIKMDFIYNKFLYNIRKPVRIIPLAIVCNEDYLNVVGYDLISKKTKQYMIDRIIRINTGLYDSWLRRVFQNSSIAIPEFDYNKFFSSKEGYFQFGPVKYRMQITGNSYDYFLHTYSAKVKEFKVIKETDENNRIIEFVSFDERQVFDIAFAFGKQCRLLEPEESVRKYLNKIYEIAEHYGKNNDNIAI